MKNEELFNRTVDILVKAYQNDTLEASACAACACGNIAAAASGVEVIRHYDGYGWSLGKSPRWNNVFCSGQLASANDALYKEGLKEIESTGYTVKEFMAIEEAFMSGYARGLVNYEDAQLSGLLSVYDVLCEIHEVNKEEVTKGELVFVR